MPHHYLMSQPFIRFLASPVLLAILLVSTAYGQNDLTDIPQPDPAAEQQAMVVASGAQVDLYAADPMIRKPIQINFDHRGRLWVASSDIYPQIEPGEKANDQILVLEDTDGDGAADQQTVFADGLLIPTGVVPDGRGGAYVAASTELLHLVDTDGDGRADQRRIVLSGFGTEDTHHLLHTLRWGPDGCLYLNQSIYIHSHVDTPYGTRHLNGGGIWRYRPESGQLEVFCKGFINPWGHVFDPHGESFVTDGAFFEGINYTFPDAVFVTSPGATRWLSGLNPGSPKHCGLEILSGRHLPPDWQGDLVTNDFRSHRVCRFTVRPSGSGYLSHQQPEILTSDHVAFRPIDARMGPDGALYIADWYNPIIQHGEVDFRDPRRDRGHGRIWRVSFPDRPLDRWPDFASLTSDQLIDLLEAPSLAVRQFARQQLWQVPAAQSAALRDRLLQWSRRAADPQQRSARQLEYLWICELHQQPPVAAIAAQVARRVAAQDADPDERESRWVADPSRRPALRSVMRSLMDGGVQPATTAAQDAAVRLAGPLATDADPAVRLEAVAWLGRLDSLSAAEAAIAAAELPLDANLDFALWQTMRKLSNHWVPALAADRFDWRGHEQGLAFAVAAVGTAEAAEPVLQRIEADRLAAANDHLIDAVAASADADQMARLLRTVLSQLHPQNVSPPQAARLQRIVTAAAARKVVPTDGGTILAGLLADAPSLLHNAELAAMVVEAAGQWRAPQMVPVLVTSLPETVPPLRQQIIQALGRIATPEAIERLIALAQAGPDADRLAAAEALAAPRPQQAATTLADLLPRTDRSAATADVVGRLVSRKGFAERLVETLRSQSLPADRARQTLQAVRAGGGHAGLEAALQKAGRLDDAGWKLTDALSREILSAVEQHGSPQRGQQIYRRAALQCIQCHAIGPAGGLVGPNLISLGGSAQPDYILQSLIEPNARLKEGYNTLSVLTDAGTITQGIPVGGDDQTLRLRTADGKVVTLQRENIEAEQPGQSLMPAGSVDTLTKAELVDLVAFLAALGRDPAFSVSTDPVVRAFETLTYSSEANHVLNRTSIDAVATDNAVFTWRPITSLVDGSLPLEELDRFQQHRSTHPASFVRFDLRMAEAGNPGLDIPSQGIQMWVDGKPAPMWETESLTLSAGDHRITLAIDRAQFSGPLRITAEGSAVELTTPELFP